ncbi:MAG: outer membrane protein [uncultured bacterium]|nr:MAG: outer membrane protein [uncultured bacterium]
MKKLLVVSAIAALGFTSAALAGGLPEEMPMAPAAMTSDAGIYVGINGGWGLTNWKNFGDRTGVITNISNDNGVVGRAFVGYDFNRYFATEFGYSYFFNQPKLNAGSTTDYKISRTQTLDLVGKGKLPVVDNFDLYAKLGVGYMMSKVKLETTTEGIANFSGNRNVFNVVYGAGADYYITPNVIANVEWLRVNGSAKFNSTDDQKKYQPYTDAFMVGLRYKFDV